MEQRSKEWFKARRGVFTSSEVHKLMKPKSVKRYDYITEKAREEIYKTHRNTDEGYLKYHYEHGRTHEPIAKAIFEITTGVILEEVGFIQMDDFNLGASPDGLFDGGCIEVKCPYEYTSYEAMKSGSIPFEYQIQMQTVMGVTNRDQCVFTLYWESQIDTTLIPFNQDIWDQILEAVQRAEIVRQKLIKLWKN